MSLALSPWTRCCGGARLQQRLHACLQPIACWCKVLWLIACVRMLQHGSIGKQFTDQGAVGALQIV